MRQIENRRTKILNGVIRLLLVILVIIFAMPLYITFVNIFKPTGYRSIAGHLSSAPCSGQYPHRAGKPQCTTGRNVL